MKITLYVRTYPVKDAPVALSLVPFPPSQRHTYTRDGAVYDAVSGEMRVTVPDGSVVTVPSPRSTAAVFVAWHVSDA